MAPCKKACTAAGVLGSAGMAVSAWLPGASASSSDAGTCSSGGQCTQSISNEHMLLQTHVNRQASAQLSLTEEDETSLSGCRAASGAANLDTSVTDEGCAAACAIIPQGTWPCDESGLCTCEATTTTTTTTTTTAAVVVDPSPAPAPTTVPPTNACGAVWTQCGGKSWTGTTCCDQGLSCEFGNEWYSQCKPSSSVSSPSPSPATSTKTTTTVTTSAGSTSAPTTGSTGWDGDNMKMTHYWDCSGQGCDASTLQPWDANKYVSPPGYGPQDPEEHGGALYGEKMWLTGAASDALSALMGDDDGCCGGDPNDGGVGGCGKCALVQNPDSMHPDWTAVVMKKNRCPPWSNGCGDNEPHFDVAAPGFDNLQWSTANICGLKPGTGFESQAQSEAVGSWWTQCSNTADCAHLCDKLPADFRDGCKLFASWGWKRGDPPSVKFKAVPCPAAFVEHVSKQFGPSGVTA